MSEKINAASETTTEPVKQPTSSWLRSFFIPLEQTVPEDDLQAALQAGRERLLTTILRGNVVLAGLALAAFIITNLDELYLGQAAVFIVVYFGLIVFAFVRRIPYQVRGAILLAWIYGLGFQGLLATGLSGDGRLLIFAFVIVSFLLFDSRIGLFALLLGLGALVFTAWQMTSGSIVVPIEILANSSNVSSWTTGSFTFLALVGIILLALSSQARDIQKIWRRQQALRQTLQEERTLLEQRVAERTRALETSVEVSRQLSSILEVDKLASEVVEKIRIAYDYYHAQIYVYDDARKNLVLIGGSGNAGQALLSQAHKVANGQGLVGQAAATGQVVLVSDVTLAEGWLPNELMPETKSEAAVPIVIGERVIGVLDVQHDVVDGLKAGDVVVLQSVATQVGIALRNASLYTQAQQQAQQESMVNEIGRQIRSATNVEMVLEVAARELGQKLGAARTRIEVSRERIGGNGRIPKSS